jgi:hypothetical protein
MSPTSSGPGQWNRHIAFRALLRRSSQNHAYPRASPRIANRGRAYRLREAPASGHARGTLVPEMGLVAMQKVEGSNPFSRFSRIPRKSAAFRWLSITSVAAESRASSSRE